ncbi:MAG: cbb3-type cytochrome c oxidase subunit 3 [Proteobacteria bacterium]|nr:cbb3-type cytochrome c oxidase subunit 3 [Pseudomonadota bacterium]
MGTDWSALTTSDWIGLTVTVVIFIVMIVLYVYVLRPKNREKLESHRYMIMNEDSSDKEDKKNE